MFAWASRKQLNLECIADRFKEYGILELNTNYLHILLVQDLNDLFLYKIENWSFISIRKIRIESPEMGFQNGSRMGFQAKTTPPGVEEISS